MRALDSLLFFSFSLLLVGTAKGQQIDPCLVGQWETAFNHSSQGPACSGPWPQTYNAVHMALIPKGDFRGWVVVWDHSHWPDITSPRFTRWALVKPDSNPANRIFHNA